MQPSRQGPKAQQEPERPTRAPEPEVTGSSRQRSLDCALLIVAASAALLTVVIFLRGYHSTLYADSWSVLMSYQSSGYRVTAQALFGFHNEHRPLFARIPILLDMWLDGGRSWIPFGTIFLVQAAHAWLLWRIAARQTWFENRYRALIISLAVFCCFYFSQMENFLWAFQTAFVLGPLFATGAVAAVAAQKEAGQKTGKWAAMVVLCSLGAPLCMASGVFVWWLVVAVAIGVRLPWKWIVGYAAAGAVTMAAYLYGYVRPAWHNNPLDAVRKPFEILAYAGRLLGSSWRWWPLELGEALCAGALVLLAIQLIAFVRTGRKNPWEAVPLAVMIFSAGTALLTALGRLSFGMKQAEQSRYQTPALLFWFMAALLMMGILRKYDGRWSVAFAVFGLVSMIWSFAGASKKLVDVQQERVQFEIAGAAWLSGVADVDAMKWMISGDQLPLGAALRERHFGPFSVPPGSELGKPLPIARIQLGSYCEGRFRREASFFETQWPGIRLRGWARRTSDGAPITRFLATTVDRRIVGVGVEGIAFAAVKSASEQIVVFGLPGDGKACAIVTD